MTSATHLNAKIILIKLIKIFLIYFENELSIFYTNNIYINLTFLSMKKETLQRKDTALHHFSVRGP